MKSPDDSISAQDTKHLEELQNESLAYAEFTPVKSRKNRKNSKRTILKDRLGISPLQSLLRLRERLRKEDDEWFTSALRVLSDLLTKKSLVIGSNDYNAMTVLCLGLGSPTGSQSSNVQLAFLLELKEHLNLASDRISLYDPVFTDEDTSLFNQLGLTVPSENRDGRYTLDTPTLCLMFHCDMELYNSILEFNWATDNLRNLILIGNRLSDYIDSKPSQKLRQNVPYLFHIAPKLKCLPFSTSKLWPTAFNNTCIQYLAPNTVLEEVAEPIVPAITGSRTSNPDKPSSASECELTTTPSTASGIGLGQGGGRTTT